MSVDLEQRHCHPGHKYISCLSATGDSIVDSNDLELESPFLGSQIKCKPALAVLVCVYLFFSCSGANANYNDSVRGE